ncbi:MAG: hypothetical protein H5T86_07285 [Armatimonadetes bacterium]|nr:hypothetical protein [Armatimonadota bacterium]
MTAWYGRAFLLWLVVACVPPVFQVWRGRTMFTSLATERWREDCDRVLIYEGLQKPDFVEWIMGRWVGQVPFWRPVTSFLFYGQYRVFGWQRQDLWSFVNACAFAIDAVLLFVLMSELSSRPWVGALAVWVAFGPVPQIFGWTVVRTHVAGSTLTAWKNQPDTFLAAAALLSCTLAARGSPWWIAPAVIGAGLKESGFAIFPMAVLLWWWRFRSLRWHLWVGCALALLLFVHRWHAVGPGYILGSNRHVIYRMALKLLPYPLVVVSSPVGPFAVLGMAAAAAVLDRRRWLCWIAAGPVVSFLLNWAWFRQLGFDDPAVAIAGLIDMRLWTVGFPMFLWLWIAVRGWSRLLLPWATGYVLFALPCTMAPQVLDHAYHTAELFAAGCVAQALSTAAARPLDDMTPERLGLRRVQVTVGR